MKKEEQYLVKKGINVATKGFDYLCTAIRLIKEDRLYKLNITKKLYPKIAEMFNDTPSRVERAMRHSILQMGIKKSVSEFVSLAELELRNK